MFSMVTDLLKTCLRKMNGRRICQIVGSKNMVNLFLLFKKVIFIYSITNTP